MQVRTFWIAGTVIALSGVVLLVQGPHLARLRELSGSAMRTEGVVIAFDGANHNRATYSYRIGGIQYSGYEEGSSRRPGDRVTVFYLKTDPAVSEIHDPAYLFRQGVWGTVAMCGFLILGGLIAALRIT